MHTELFFSKVQKNSKKQTFVGGFDYRSRLKKEQKLLVLFPQVLHQSLTHRVELAGHIFVAGSRQRALRQPANTVNIEALHVLHGHIL